MSTDGATFAVSLHAIRTACRAAYARATSASGTVLGEDGDRTRLAQPLLPVAYLASDEERAAAFAAYAAAEIQPQMSGMGDTVGVHCVCGADLLVSLYLDFPSEPGSRSTEQQARALWAHALGIAKVVRETLAPK